jgi:hypothetical protein
MTHAQQATSAMRQVRKDCEGRYYVQAIMNIELAIAAVGQLEAENEALRQRLDVVEAEISMADPDAHITGQEEYMKAKQARAKDVDFNGA